MIISRDDKFGFWFKFEKNDWRGDWRRLLNFVKDGDHRADWSYCGTVGHRRQGWWWVADYRSDEFFRQKKACIDDLIVHDRR